MSKITKERENEKKFAPPHTAATQPDYLGPYPVCLGENAKSYEQLRRGLMQFFAPSDPIENIYVRDMADADWQLQRVNRAKANSINAIQLQAVTRVLIGIHFTAVMRPVEDEGLAESPGEDKIPYYARDVASAFVHQVDWARAAVAEALEAAGLSEDVFIAEAMSIRSAELERMDRSALWHQAARDQAMANLYRHRENKAAMRKPAPPIEDAEFRVIENGRTPAGADSAQQRALAA